MKPGGGGRPSGQLLQLIERDFGSLERMLMELKAAASTQFGSGWAWLVCELLLLNCLPNLALLHSFDISIMFKELLFFFFLFALTSDKANKLDVGNAVNPLPSEKDNKLVVAKTPNAVNPLVWDYSVSIFHWAVTIHYRYLFYASMLLSFYIVRLVLERSHDSSWSLFFNQLQCFGDTWMRGIQ